MAIKKYKVEVTRVDEYEIELDDSVWNDEALELWSSVFSDIDEDNSQEDFVKLLAKSITSNGIKKQLEGFGFVKQKLHNMKEDQFIKQYSSGSKIISKDEYTFGLLVNIIAYDNQLEAEIFEP